MGKIRGKQGGKVKPKVRVKQLDNKAKRKSQHQEEEIQKNFKQKRGKKEQPKTWENIQEKRGKGTAKIWRKFGRQYEEKLGETTGEKRREYWAKIVDKWT